MITFKDAFTILGAQPLWPIYLVILVSACAKYMAPFLPGDTVLILSVFWIGVKGGSWPVAVAAITLGGSVGAMAVFHFGDRIMALVNRRKRMSPSKSVEAMLNRWGFWPLLFNRFLPYVRPFLFPTAGLLGVSRRTAAWCALLGNMLFGLLLAGIGYGAGKQYDRLNSLYHAYLFWLGAALVFVLLSVGAYLLASGKMAPQDGGKAA